MKLSIWVYLSIHYIKREIGKHASEREKEEKNLRVDFFDAFWKMLAWSNTHENPHNKKKRASKQ